MNQMRHLPQPRHRRLGWSACCVLWLASGAGAHGQFIGLAGQAPGQAPSQKKVRLSGTVVNAVTGEGIWKAKVEIYAGEPLAVFSGSGGHFEFENVQEGQWQVVARKPGYFGEQELAHGAYRPKVFAVNENSGEITVNLTPSASIAGHVVDDKGEPVESAQVEVIARVLQNGRRIWQARGSANTDEEGEYSISSLIPGDYYLRIRPVVAGGLPRLPGHGYDEVYSGCYYPSAPTQDQAAPVHLTGGQQAQADFTLLRVRAYRVFGHVAMSENQAGLNVFRGDEDTGISAPVLKGGRFILAGLAPGQYSIVARQYNAPQGPGLYGEQMVTIGQADVNNVEILVQQPQSIPVQINVVKTRESGSNGLVQLETFSQPGPQHGQPVNGPSVPIGNVALEPTDPALFQRHFAQLNPNNPGSEEPLALKGAFPGVYRVIAQPFQPYYIESMRSGSIDLRDQPLTITPGGAVAPIQITLRDDSATLTVKVNEGGQPAPGGALLVMPTSHTAETIQPMYWMGGSGLGLGGLAPGDYRVYAFDSIEDLEYANPEAMRNYSSQSQPVTLGPNASSTVTVELISLSKQRSVE
jgi:Carboxypeptidase regulatory-like domain